MSYSAKIEGIPDLYRGCKTHFNMCCDLSLFNPETKRQNHHLPSMAMQ